MSPRQIETALLRPTPGRRVKDPETLRPLAAEGEVKPLTTYWLRLIMFGDVEIFVADPVVEETAKTKKKHNDKETA